MAHVPALQASQDFQLVAVSSSTLATAQQAALQFNARHAFGSYQELLACPEVELVVVTVKVPYHFELASAAIAAGKAVYCEWPLANGLREAQTLHALAEQRGVRTVAGLQSRASPAMRYLRELIRDGYVGEVLSATLLASGVIGGALIPQAFAYTLDPAFGAGILNVAGSHALDAMSFVLGQQFADVATTLANRRRSVQVAETGETIAMRTPDQIALNGRLACGAVVSAHIRGGMSRGANFRLEINGTRGDLVVSSTLGYPGIGDTSIQGGQDDDATVHELPLPPQYRNQAGADGMAANVAANYALLAADLRNGTHHAPSFADALALHQLVDAIERSAADGARRQT